MKLTEKNLFMAVCSLFVILAASFTTGLIVSEPDLKKPAVNNAKTLPPEPLPPVAGPFDITPPTLPGSDPAFDVTGQLPPPNTPTDTGTVVVNIANGRNSQRSLFCRLTKDGVDIQQVQVSDALCSFVKLSPGVYDVELNDGITVIDQQRASLEGAAGVSVTLVAKNAKTFCRDSDNGLAYDQFGITIDQYGKEFPDVCISDRIVREFYCEDNQLKQSDTTCSSACLSGVCK
ncbi:hypothetical protein HGA34_01450 [Candidatus Falkowbacteria bacterium]|nr:hypothetical protein [Candidatus Falkowbacteria bacterium]